MTVHVQAGGADAPDARAPGDVTLLYLIKQLELAVRSSLEGAVGGAGLTSLQYTALTVLERRPGLTSAELARNSFVRAQTMAQMIGDLESRGLLRREVDPSSRRQNLLFLDTAGLRLVTELRAPVAEVEASMVEGLAAGDIHRLRSLLRHCRAALAGTHPH